MAFVFADEFSQGALGFRDEESVLTPCLDKFAADSLELSEVISNCPVCSPHRGVLFTGKYPWSFDVWRERSEKEKRAANYQ